MPLYDKDGKEMPGSMTAEEVQAKVAEATSAATSTAKADADKVQETLKTQLTEAQRKLDAAAADAGQQPGNAEMRRVLEDTQKLVKDLETKVTEAPRVAQQMIMSNTKDGVIKKLANGDASLEAKIKLNYDKLIKLENEITEDTISKVAADSYKLSVDVFNPNVLNSVIPSKPAGGPANQQDQSKVSQEVAPWLSAFGIKEEDFVRINGKRK